MHRTVEPPILYFGTPVVLVSTVNEDGSYNLAPMSSAWWLGWNCLLGFGMRSKTPQNLIRTRECVLNLPSAKMASAVNRLAKLTGSDPVPEHKVRMGYRHEANKFGVAGFTSSASEIVGAPRVLECPVQLEATLTSLHRIDEGDEERRGKLGALEVKIRRVHVDEGLLMDGYSDRIDPDKWKPLIMSFQQFYGLTERVHYSKLAEIPESSYRSAPAQIEMPARG